MFTKMPYLLMLLIVTLLPAGMVMHHSAIPRVTAASGLHAPVLAPWLSQPATTRIEGRVFDEQTGKPVVGAVIALDTPPEAATTTDAAGNFVLASLPITGSYRLVTMTVQADGYGMWTMRDTILYPDITRLLEIGLQQQEVTIQAGLPRALSDEPGPPDDPELFPPLPPVLSAVSHDEPPTTIRVARTGFTHCQNWINAGRPVLRVETYDFRDYVKNVLPNEWIARWHPDALRAGAMAVKTFAWYQVLTRVRAPYGADILDNTCDQYFVPNTRQSSTDAAVDDTWNYALHRNGRILSIHYLNSRARCDSTPYQPCMPQEGTQEDALAGHDWRWILNRYYAPIEIDEIGNPPPPTLTPTMPPLPTFTPTPTLPRYSYEYVSQQPVPGDEPFWLTTPGVLELRMRNTGDTTWYRNRSEGCSVHLGTGELESSDEPLRVRDHLSPFYAPGAAGWLHEASAAGRRVLMLEDQVEPGQIATFHFDITLPVLLGEVRSYWSPVVEGPGCADAQWLPGTGMHFWLFVFPFHYSIVDHTPPDDAWHRDPSEFALVLRNEGPATWYQAEDTPGNSSGYAVHLATGRPGEEQNPNPYYRPDHSSPFYTPDGTGWWNGTQDRNRITMLEQVVPPGETATFRFAATVPPIAGMIDAAFTPVVEYLGWMDPQAGTRLHINNNPYRAELKQQLPAATQEITMLAWSTQTFTVTLRNTGYAPWEQSSTFLDTIDPDTGDASYASPFADLSWLQSDHPARLREKQVAPGKTGSFVFTIHAPFQPGNYTLRVRPVTAGTWWMENPDHEATWRINVTPLSPDELSWLYLPYLMR